MTHMHALISQLVNCLLSLDQHYSRMARAHYSAVITFGRKILAGMMIHTIYNLPPTGFKDEQF